MMTIAAPRGRDERAESMPRMSVVLTSAFAVFTVGATVVVVFAAFAALLVGGGAGGASLFALVAGSLAFSTLVLVQSVQWATLLLRHLRGNP